MLGTYTSDEEPNYLMVLNAAFPEGQTQGSAEIETKINHNGEVLKVKHMPQPDKTSIIATKATNGEINIYDYSKIKGKKKKSLIKPDLRLRGHSQKGYGLDWSTLKEGLIISGAEDSNVIFILNSGLYLGHQLCF